MKSNPFSLPITATATGATSSLAWVRRPGHFAVQGTFGGTTAKLQYSLDEGITWLDYTGASQDAAGGSNFNLPDCLVRAFLTSGTSISVSIYILPLSNK